MAKFAVHITVAAAILFQIRTSLKNHRMGVSKRAYQHTLLPAQKVLKGIVQPLKRGVMGGINR